MCGIAGGVEWRGGDRRFFSVEEATRKMLAVMSHRGPDGEGVCSFKSGNLPLIPGTVRLEDRLGRESWNVALGHRRLAIIDLSEQGRQPMSTPGKRLHIVFNGEIYNYLELRKELQDSYSFVTKTDTEVLLAGYHRWGEGVLERLDGMFSFVIFDSLKNELFAARDPVGIKPFYYLLEGNLFLFASEPKALRLCQNARSKFDPSRTAEFLLFGLSDHDDGTMFSGIRQLEGGCSLRLQLQEGAPEVSRYWVPPRPRNDLSGDIASDYRLVATKAVSRQLRSDVPVGSSLSGGIDSSAIVALVGSLMGSDASKYTALTFSFPGFSNDESQMAAEVARMAGVRHEQVVPDVSSLASDLDRLVWVMDEPFTSLSMLAQFKVMQRASELGLKVMLDGQGGDEVYLGYPRMAGRVAVDYLLQGDVVKFLREWQLLSKNQSVGMLDIICRNLYFNSPALFRGRAASRVGRYVEKDYLSNCRREVLSNWMGYKPVEERQLDELQKFCLPRLLKYADRNSMAFSVEQRVPHLSRIVLDFALAVPVAERVRDGWPKAYVRRAMEGLVPSSVLYANKKRGFEVPQQVWLASLAGVLSEWVSDLPKDTPIKRDVLLADLKSKDYAKHACFWPVVSLALSSRKFNMEF